MKGIERRTGVLSIIMSCLLMVFCSSNAIASEQIKNGSALQNQAAPLVEGYNILNSSYYLNTNSESIISLPKDFSALGVQAVSMEGNNQFIPIEFNINKDILSITPFEPLVDGKTYSVRIFASDSSKYLLQLKAYNLKSIDFNNDTYVKIPANPAKGFNYPYFLFIPRGADKSDYNRLMVEPNNTGSVSDDLNFHEEYAEKLVKGIWNGGQGRFVAEYLKIPLLVPAFPRPMTFSWERYTHDLSRSVMDIKDGNLKRIDLQLVAMIKDAQSMLNTNGLKTQDKVFMTGFSASGSFCNRFTMLHPDIVKAVFCGGLSTLPVDTWASKTLNFPFGIADISKYTGKPFDKTTYMNIAQFCYMGDLDNNQNYVTPGMDGFTDADLTLFNQIYPPRLLEQWKVKGNILTKTGFDRNIQLHLYKGIGHGIPSSVWVDIIAFFIANNGDTIAKINAHETAWPDNWYEELLKVLNN